MPGLGGDELNIYTLDRFAEIFKDARPVMALPNRLRMRQEVGARSGAPKAGQNLEQIQAAQVRMADC